MSEKKDLLEALAKRLGCNYLSDLRAKGFQGRAVRTALEFSPEEYSASQWQDAASYLLSLTRQPQSAEQARALLQSWEETHPSEN